MTVATLLPPAPCWPARERRRAGPSAAASVALALRDRRSLWLGCLRGCFVHRASSLLPRPSATSDRCSRSGCSSCSSACSSASSLLSNTVAALHDLLPGRRRARCSSARRSASAACTTRASSRRWSASSWMVLLFGLPVVPRLRLGVRGGAALLRRARRRPGSLPRDPRRRSACWSTTALVLLFPARGARATRCWSASGCSWPPRSWSLRMLDPERLAHESGLIGLCGLPRRLRRDRLALPADDVGRGHPGAAARCACRRAGVLPGAAGFSTAAMLVRW